MPATPPTPCSRSTVASSISARQSHSTLPAGGREDRALPDAECRGGLDGRKPCSEAPELVAVRVP